MKINFTKKQYENLLKLVYLGNWMINAIRSGRKGDEVFEEYEKMVDYIYSFAKKFGLEKYVVFDKKFNQFFPTGEFEENTDVNKFKDDYDEELFWEELIVRLARRDFIEKYGEKAIMKMDFDERIEKEYPFEKKYRDEFYKDGLINLKIKRK